MATDTTTATNGAARPARDLAHQPFSYAYYERMLGAAVDQGYAVTSFERYNSDRPRTIILRHDVDYTLDGLLRFAEIESRLGCSAAYLFRVHADEYNLFSCMSYSILRRIAELGHEIGLHFEVMNVGRALGVDPTELLRRERATIEAILGHPVHTASEHREISGTVHNTPLYHEDHDPYAAGFRFYAMDPKYCREMKYLSDSNAHWREGDLLEHLGQHDRFQILVHPDWWFETDLLLKGPYYHPRSTHV